MIGQTPFWLVYGKEFVMPMEYIVPSLRIATFTNMDDLDIMKEIMLQLIAFEEDKFIARFHQQVKKERENS